MRLMVELSGEHPSLPRAELEAVLDLAGGRIVELDGAVAIVDAPEPSFLASRLALAHTVSEHWWSGPVTSVAADVGARDLVGARFAVRPRAVEGAHASVSLTQLAREAGEALARTGKVDLKAPEVDVRILLSHARAHAGRLLHEVDRKAFEARHVKHRAHFAPVSLHPRYARALVNLARVRAGERVADPFVGTGGLVIEAGLVGARVYASDLDPRMAAGTRDTLAQFGVAGATVEARDVGELPRFVGEPLDVVLSDPPYGKSSTTNREAMDDLYERFFAAAHDALRPGGRLAIIVPTEELRQRAMKRFRLVEAYEQRVHRSMTRHWGVFARI